MKIRYWILLLAIIVPAVGFYVTSVNPYDLKFLDVKNVPKDITFVCNYSIDNNNHASLMNFYGCDMIYESIEPLDTLLGCVRDTERGLLRLPIQWPRTTANWGLLCRTKDRKWIVAPVEVRPSVWSKTIVVSFETLKRSEELPPDLKQQIEEVIEEERKFRKENGIISE